MKFLLLILKNFFVPTYSVRTRDVSGTEGSVLTVHGRKNLRNFIEDTEKFKYGNIILIERVIKMEIEPPIKITRKSVWYSGESTEKVGDYEYQKVGFKNYVNEHRDTVVEFKDAKTLIDKIGSGSSLMNLNSDQAQIAQKMSRMPDEDITQSETNE